MKNMDDYIDKLGMIIHLNENAGGDSAQRMGMDYIFKYFNEPLIRQINAIKYHILVIKQLFIFDVDEWIRHPDILKWYGRLGTFSRDQMISNIISMGLYSSYYRNIYLTLLETENILKKRYWFLWNTKRIGQIEEKPKKIPDCGGLVLPALFIRALSKKNEKWKLYFYDITLFIGSLGRILSGILNPVEGSFIQRKILDNVGPDINHLLKLKQAQCFYPTIISEVSRKIYFKYRKNAGQPRLKNVTGPQSAFDWYFRKTEDPPMNETLRITKW